jgi:mono/diheme cytochrome c family protein
MRTTTSIAVFSWTILVIVAFSLALSVPARAATGSPEAKKIFNQRCTACHSFGKGIKVGPDLKGVTKRRERPWLLKFIRSSQGVIGGGDPIATKLFADFKKQRMPDWTDLSEAQITAILEWFAVDGPEQKEPDERNAALATAAEIGVGRALFSGATPQANGGLACAACHTIQDGDGADKGTAGGTLGPDLSISYARYQDRAMTLFLKKPCSPRAPQKAEYLTPQESFAIKAYLRQATVAKGATGMPSAEAAPASSSGEARMRVASRVRAAGSHKRGIR